MNTFTKSVALATVMMASAGLTPQFTLMQSTSQAADCTSQNGAPLDCTLRKRPNMPAAGSTSNPRRHQPSHPNGPPVSSAPAGAVIGGQSLHFQHQAGGWQFDPRRHHRQGHRDSVFQYGFGGFFYDQPYWQLPQQPIYVSRISCAHGRSIVASRGYNFVRTISCTGLTYTYQARRLNRNYRVSVNARRGTISGAYLD